jgi:DNA invertase Pin-like site-specific DNA recombinase
MIRLCTYQRTSKEESDPARQGATLEHWATSKKLEIAKVYLDHGGRRHEADDPKKRPAWNQLLADVREGLWDCVAVEELTRLGFKDEWKLMELCSFLRDHSVELWEAKSDRHCNGDTVSDFLVTGIGGHQSRAEVTNLATRSLGKKILDAKAGVYQGGPVPHGMALACRAPAGIIKWTVEVLDGRKVQIHADGTEIWIDRIPKDRPLACNLYLVPSIRYPERHEHIRQIYRWFLDEHVTMRAIALRLNELGIRPQSGGLWYGQLIKRVLESATYTGQLAYGRRRQGRYATIADGVPVARPGTGKQKSKKPDEWIWSDQYCDAIVSQEVWKSAQRKLETERGAPRRGKNQALILSGLVSCAGCGKRMSGVTRTGRGAGSYYACPTYAKLGAKESPCGPNAAHQADLLDRIQRWLEETGHVVKLATANEEGLLSQLYSKHADTRAALAPLRDAMRWKSISIIPYPTYSHVTTWKGASGDS